MPVPMDKQILFLFSALKGYLDWIPVRLVFTFESLLYSYYETSPFFYPLSHMLQVKNNEFDNEIIPYFLYTFTEEFIVFADEYYNAEKTQ